LEMLAEQWYQAKCVLVTLQSQALAIQQSIIVLQQPHDDSHDPGGPMRRQIQIRALQTQLVVLAPQIAMAQRELGKIDGQVRSLRLSQAKLTGQAEASTEKWGTLCDVFGRLGPVAHHKALPLFDRWIAEEPRLWQLYLARGVARLHVSQNTRAIEDFNRVEGKLRLYGSRSGDLALITALQAYALCKQNEPCDGCKLFADAKKLDGQSWQVCQVRGWTNLEQRKYTAAKSDFRLALSLSRNRQAEPHEAMALLLAACPDEHIRDGEKAVKHAARACELTKRGDWICLDTLGAAHAEAGDFESAIKSASEAIKLAPSDRQVLIRERIEFYKDKVAYRLK
jgi:tetratricopeptide (TPR) repeat protein